MKSGVPDSLDLNVQRKRKVLSPDRLKAKKILSQHPTVKPQKTKGLVNICRAIYTHLTLLCKSVI